MKDFNIIFSLLVPPVLYKLSADTVYIPTGGEVSFSVRITTAQPPVTSRDLSWTGGSFKSNQQKILSYANGVATLVLKNLEVFDSGIVALMVNHPASTNLNQTFNLVVLSE